MEIKDEIILNHLEKAYLDYKNAKEMDKSCEIINRKRGICNGIESIIFEYAKYLVKDVLILRKKIFEQDKYLDIPTVFRQE